MTLLRRIRPSRTSVLVFFIYIVPAFVCLSAVLGYYLLLPYILGAPAPGAEIVDALSNNNAEMAMRLALDFKKHNTRRHVKQNRTDGVKDSESELSSRLLSLAYELNGNLEMALNELAMCQKCYSNRYRFAYLEYNVGKRQEAFEDYLEIAGGTITTTRDLKRDKPNATIDAEHRYYTYKKGVTAIRGK